MNRRHSPLLCLARQGWFDLDRDQTLAAEQARALIIACEGTGDELAPAYARCTLGCWLGSTAGGVAQALDLIGRIEAVVRRGIDPHLVSRYHCTAASVLGSPDNRSRRFEHLEKMRLASIELGGAWHELVALRDLALVFHRQS